MPKRRFPRKPAANELIKSEGLDRDDRFVLQRVAGYLERLLARYPLFDRNLVDVLVWVLGPDMAHYGQALCENSKAGTRQDFFDQLNDCLADPDDYDGVITRHVITRKAIGTAKAIKITRQFLEQRRRKLAYQGRSELEKNTAAIQRVFGLNDLETELCLIFFIMSAYNTAETYFEGHLELERFEGRKYLRTMLGISTSEMGAIIRGRLASLEILDTSLGSICVTSEYMGFFQEGKRILSRGELFNQISGKPLPLDYHPVEPEITQYLLKLLAQPAGSSTHVLFYGQPGTGKTSYAKGLIAELGQTGYEIGLEGEKNTTSRRRAALLACLNLTEGGKGGIVVMDEADNVLNTEGSWFKRGETQDKGWLNQVLERPGARVVWLTNDISAIDESVQRRFALSVCFRPFSRSQRINLWRNILKRRRCKAMLTDQEVRALAEKYKVSAGVADLAVTKARETAGRNKPVFRKGVELSLRAHLTLKNGGIRPLDREKVETGYSIEGLNTQGDIPELLRSLKLFDAHLRSDESGGAKANLNLLFYGPPGCGKSELARHIGHVLDRELLVKRASDILDPYVGMTEQKIATAFAEAEAEEAVLVMDEIDSLLYSRADAVRSWEVSFTNEFLTRMERFRGILICTTNRMEALDPASIRRFNRKIGFDYLTGRGNLVFFDRLLGHLTREGLTPKEESRLKSLEMLTPGDFKIVRDKFSFPCQGELAPVALIQALEEEVEIKMNQLGRAVGF